MKTRLTGLSLLMVFLSISPLFAKFIVFSSTEGIISCQNKSLVEGHEISTLSNGISFNVKLPKGAELIVLDTRFKQQGKYGSWIIRPLANYTVCTIIEIRYWGLLITATPKANASTKFNGYIGYKIFEIIPGTEGQDTPAPTKPAKSKGQIETPADLPKKTIGSGRE